MNLGHKAHLEILVPRYTLLHRDLTLANHKTLILQGGRGSTGVVGPRGEPGTKVKITYKIIHSPTNYKLHNRVVEELLGTQVSQVFMDSG